jgi:serralysin
VEAEEIARMQVCLDRVLDPSEQYQASELAREETERNTPDGSLMGDMLARGLEHPESLVMLTGKKWQTGRTLRICFVDGPEWAHDKAMSYFVRWTRQANLKMVKTADRRNSDLRVTFKRGGSWSFLGTDNLAIPADRPTMQLGWLVGTSGQSTAGENEWQRVCLHEMGHALDFAHEQSHPKPTFEWNKPAVYELYGGPPNNWSRETVDRQVLFRYSALNTNYSSYDKESIMHYSIPAALVMDPTDVVGWNTDRSYLDKQTAALWYPKTTMDSLLAGLVRAQEVAAPVSER